MNVTIKGYQGMKVNEGHRYGRIVWLVMLSGCLVGV